MQANHDGIDEAILQTAKECTRRVLADKRSPFYPSRDDLLGIVLLKLTLARAHVESIWNSSDATNGGLVGLQRFAFVVARHAMIDEARRNQVHAPEILAVRLNERLTDADGEDCGTIADTISDEIALPQAFRLEDLQSEMGAEEFDLLYKSFAEGATIRELADERGENRSDVGRIAASAKGKARKWIEWLRRASDKQVRAHISLTFEKKPCLRPDKISNAALDSWQDGIQVALFHDEAREWHPPITKQPHVRAKRECWNAACQNGLAIGPDNLVLPSARRDEAVRFLPAYTGQDNRKCAGCEQAAKRADTISSDEATETARQIGRAQSNVEAIPSRDDLFADEEQRNFFIEDETKGNFLRRNDIIRVIKERELPKQQLADIANVPAARLSDFLRNRQVPEEQAERIAEAVTNILLVWKTFAPIKIALDDPEAFQKAVELANKVQAKLADEIAEEAVLDGLTLRMKSIEGGAAAD